MKKGLVPLLVIGLLQGCFVEPNSAPEFPVGRVEGYKPVYVTASQSGISFMASRPLQHPGKIYLYGRYLLVNERAMGIHVYDNNDPAHPVALGFLSIPGNSDIAVRNGVLYADHLGDLVALDVSQWGSPKEISRIHQAHWVSEVPPAGHRYFECVDPARGIIVDWELATLSNPKCFR